MLRGIAKPVALAKEATGADTSASPFPKHRVSFERAPAPPMQRTFDTELRELLVRLKAEHRDLDAEIIALEQAGSVDVLTVKRLKKRKLALKDHIQAVEDQLFPDIIA